MDYWLIWLQIIWGYVNLDCLRIMTKLSFYWHGEPASNLLGLIHTNLCALWVPRKGKVWVLYNNHYWFEKTLMYIYLWNISWNLLKSSKNSIMKSGVNIARFLCMRLDQCDRYLSQEIVNHQNVEESFPTDSV